VPERADARRNRERVLRAAAEAFAEFGAGASMQLIAERAGLTKMTLYRHFGSKEELLQAIKASHLERLHEIAGEAADLDEYAGRAARYLAPARVVPAVASEELEAALSALLAADGAVREDVTASDVHAVIVAIAGSPLPNETAMTRFLMLYLDGIAPS